MGPIWRQNALKKPYYLRKANFTKIDCGCSQGSIFEELGVQFEFKNRPQFDQKTRSKIELLLKSIPRLQSHTFERESIDVQTHTAVQWSRHSIFFHIRRFEQKSKVCPDSLLLGTALLLLRLLASKIGELQVACSWSVKHALGLVTSK